MGRRVERPPDVHGIRVLGRSRGGVRQLQGCRGLVLLLGDRLGLLGLSLKKKNIMTTLSG